MKELFVQWKGQPSVFTAGKSCSFLNRPNYLQIRSTSNIFNLIKPINHSHEIAQGQKCVPTAFLSDVCVTSCTVVVLNHMIDYTSKFKSMQDHGVVLYSYLYNDRSDFGGKKKITSVTEEVNRTTATMEISIEHEPEAGNWRLSFGNASLVWTGCLLIYLGLILHIILYSLLNYYYTQNRHFTHPPVSMTFTAS